MTMKLPNLRESSTKRGIVWIIGGGWILIQAWRGQSVNPDALFSKLDFWLGIVMTIAGAFGLLPDEPKNVRIELPPIELVAQEGRDFYRPDALVERRNPAVDRLRDLPARPGPGQDSRPDAEAHHSSNGLGGYNGA
jgi:hypothetical protein